jgi:hypothetical protein
MSTSLRNEAYHHVPSAVYTPPPLLLTYGLPACPRAAGDARKRHNRDDSIPNA